ncbi:DUF4167 domain-containing protein [Alphaproteobacteria bacterium]|jgi:hypothetical protein|nr:DUF4167 domain-containing protein [Alphaproteobacteria bacterium]
MKNFTKRKPFGSPRKNNLSSRGAADSPYLQTNGNSNNYKRNGKNPREQYNDFLNKAKDAKGQGDEILEQFYLQHAEHYYRQIDNSPKTNFSRKIISKEKSDKSSDDNSPIEKKEPATDFDDLASQLA